jgi:glycine cleavage system H protein
MEFPAKFKYTKEHEWLSVDGEIGTVGITDYAQGELGDVVFIVLPAIGLKVKSGERLGTIEAVKTVSELYAPISGVVTEINTNLESEPELLNKEPYSGGWIVKMKFADKSELDNLLDAVNYRKLIGK